VAFAFRRFSWNLHPTGLGVPEASQGQFPSFPLLKWMGIMVYIFHKPPSPQGWRHGVHSRSPGGTAIVNLDNKKEETPSIVLGFFSLSFRMHQPSGE
jgi:hypothetical protein